MSWATWLIISLDIYVKDLNYFKKAKQDGGAIGWPDGLHLDLDELVYDWPDVSLSTKIAGHYKDLT
jgi:hypothetical protein